MTTAARLDDTLILLTEEGMGHAPPELARTVLLKYLDVLEANETLPGAIAFYTRGVLLTIEGSPALERLARFERRGVRLIVCKTCLDFFGVAERVRVGVVGGMGDIVAAQVLARKVITV